MSYLDDRGAGMTKLDIKKNDLVIIQLESFTLFQQRLPELCSALIDAIAFVNFRKKEGEETPNLVLLPIGSTVY